ncbi:hypothetical protein [Thiohalobacter thiocyanaticus]|uniref:Uncharacterized protein n=1 Tax=Thiohalobacter thiocyanaticus TaxID=585455 RepID=A0A426QDU5_9GAMM|nr:hypothetical protein [Thiohalobacter thiocyanaticus]RRQ19935.1 hypothetical protein D6C00_14330 [Thiohalobacter thiocyanaticus]
MAELLQVTAPLLIRYPDGSRHVMAERFAHPDGILYFQPFWHLCRPASQAIHLVRGELRGEGPWKLGDAVITVLGCQGTDPDMAAVHAEWQAFIRSGAPGYPGPDAIRALACQHGACQD